jgi:predicted porin
MSRWDLRGTEDLGGGLAALYELSAHFRLDTGEPGRHPGDSAAGRFFTRAAWVGLRGSWGQLRVGRVPTGSFVQTLQFTPFGDSTFLGPFLMHTYVGSQPLLAAHGASDGSWSNSIAWNAPVLGGFGAQVQLVPDEKAGEGRRLDATVSWRGGPVAVAVSHGRIRGAALTAPRTRTDPAGAPYVMTDESSTLASASWDFGAAKLSLQAAAGRVQPRGLPQIALDSCGLNLEAPVGSGRIMAGWARTEREQAGVSDRSRQTLSFGYGHRFSRRTEVYAVVLRDQATAQASGTGFALGLRHVF